MPGSVVPRAASAVRKDPCLPQGKAKLAYEQAAGHVVPNSTVYRMLARHGWRQLAPRPRHPQADEARQQASKETPRDG